MGHRLSKITTRTGDAGETGLGDGTRVSKDSARVQALGDIDELNCVIGMVLAEDVSREVRDALGQVQHDLFDLGGFQVEQPVGRLGVVHSPSRCFGGHGRRRCSACSYAVLASRSIA